ncbi:YjfI family protein [Jiella marina]|uniref:YjfI family protein n=1 Tax=Jiella sp. LLJ827 TaxID=2917712 RepID=UPI00210116DE|nr:YjfI family protein [Jiella sp. LLJ827]
MEPWNLASLTELFASDPEALGDVDVTIVETGDVIRVTLKEKGDLDVLVTASGDQVLASVILAPADTVPRRDEFERMILSTHKLVPLSTFGIVTIDGKEWYELFGSLSARSSAHAMVEEVAVLAANAVDAADMIEEWKNGEFGA